MGKVRLVKNAKDYKKLLSRPGSSAKDIQKKFSSYSRD